MGRVETSADRSLWHMIVAPTVWALHFTACYAITAIWCAKLGDAGGLRATLAAITIAALIVVSILAVLSWRRWDFLDDRDHVHDAPTDEHRREFLGHAGFLLACLSVIGILYVSLPFLIIGTCE